VVEPHRPVGAFVRDEPFHRDHGLDYFVALRRDARTCIHYGVIDNLARRLFTVSAITLVAKNTFRESVRDRVLYNLIFFALLMIGSSLAIGELAIGDLSKVITDIGLSAMRFFGMLIAIFIGIQLVYKEIERRTVYSLLAKPLRRGEMVLGKFFGLGLTLAVNSSVMLVGVIVSILIVRRGYADQVAAVVPASYMIFLELVVTTAVALMFSTISSPAISALLTFLIYVAGNFTANLMVLAETPDASALKPILTALYYLLPNLANFAAISTASHGDVVPASRLVAATLYAFVYCGLLLAIAVAVFERRDFK
jgi:ABC-type transport system involved in multi-copper enzyme maturation permease subunit